MNAEEINVTRNLRHRREWNEYIDIAFRRASEQEREYMIRELNNGTDIYLGPPSRVQDITMEENEEIPYLQIAGNVADEDSITHGWFWALFFQLIVILTSVLSFYILYFTH